MYREGISDEDFKLNHPHAHGSGFKLEQAHISQLQCKNTYSYTDIDKELKQSRNLHNTVFIGNNTKIDIAFTDDTNTELILHIAKAKKNIYSVLLLSRHRSRLFIPIFFLGMVHGMLPLVSNYMSKVFFLGAY